MTAVSTAVRTSCAVDTHRICPGQQVLEVFAAVRIVGQQQDLRRGRQHEQDADQRLLHLGTLAFGPGEQQRAGQRGGGGRESARPTLRWVVRSGSRDDAERRHLRDGEIDEHDAAGQHLLSQRHVRDRHQHAGDQRRPQDAEVGGQRVHLSAASSLSRVSSNKPNRSFASGVPPTENGNVTAGAWTRSDSQVAAFGSL